MKSRHWALLLLLVTRFSFAAESPPPTQHIQQLDLIHFSHTDYGFTDHPAVCRDMQRRYLDIALDAALATADAPEGERFKWTAETTIAVEDWWHAATPERREQFLRMVRAGQLEVSALPLNNTPFLDAAQWHTMAHWLPEDVWQQLQPGAAVQNDVNGFPRAGARVLLDRGVRYLFSGINSDSGGPPLPRLSAFWWKQPDGRRLFAPLVDFVVAWNRLGLLPRLRLANVTEAMRELETVAGPTAPEYSGEWTDWWANGTASAPREVAASRAAKRDLAAAQSPIWGPMPAAARRTVDELNRDLCLFDEHTWGSSMSVALPYSLDTQGQWNEKARFAWRPMALAQWLLSQRARTRLVPEGEGLWLANPTRAPYTGWVKLISSCLRDDYRSVVDPASGAVLPLEFYPGVQPWARPRGPEDFSREDLSNLFPDQAPNRYARFWVEHLEPEAIKRFQLSTDSASASPPPDGRPAVELDDQGWPVAATWPGMKKPLFTTGLGDFVAVRVKGFAPRWSLPEIWNIGDAARREALRGERLEEVAARAGGRATLDETPHTLRFTQPVEHPRLGWATREVELWKGQPRARLTFRLNRLSSFAPEILYVVTPFPCDGVLPRMSCGGEPFTPFSDQIPGSCRDYFAVDGWAEYATAEGRWLWVSRDAPLMTFDRPQALARLTAPPPRTGRLLSMVYNNFWYTNFLGDQPGVMEFQS